MLWGVTQQTIEAWLRPAEGEIRGVGASSGVVEGPARVLTDVNQIGEVRDGEILVCPVTAPSWAPVFGKIKAAVSDIGGSMSHAAIVAREYGMPAVVGTGDATKRISTGQRVRVDGDRGIVQVIALTQRFTCWTAGVTRRGRGPGRRQGRRARRAGPRRAARPARLRDHHGCVLAAYGRGGPGRRGARGARGAGSGRPGRDRPRRGRPARPGGGCGRCRLTLLPKSRPACVGARRRPGGGPVQRHAGGQRRGQLRRAAGHLPGGPRHRRGARPGARLLGQPVQRRVDRLPPPPGHRRRRPGHGRRRAADAEPALGRGDVHPQPGHRRPFGGGHRGNLGAGVGPGGRRGDAGQLHGEQGDRRDHRAAGRRQAAGAFIHAERSGDLRLADGFSAAADL